jgi:hypothetical protein
MTSARSINKAVRTGMNFSTLGGKSTSEMGTIQTTKGNEDLFIT